MGSGIPDHGGLLLLCRIISMGKPGPELLLQYLCLLLPELSFLQQLKSPILHRIASFSNLLTKANGPLERTIKEVPYL